MTIWMSLAWKNIDGLRIPIKGFECHYKHLEIVLQRLYDNKSYTSPKECEFLKEEIDFFGVLTGRNGTEVNSEKVKLLQTWVKQDCLPILEVFRGYCSSFPVSFQILEIAILLTDLAKKESALHSCNDIFDNKFESL